MRLDVNKGLEKGKGLIGEFKTFAVKGNVIDMAVGVIIGGAFGKIVSSIVADLINPLIGLIVGKIQLSDLKWVISSAIFNAEGVETVPEVAVRYGMFLKNVLDFLIIALCVFIFVKFINKAKDVTAKIIAEEEAKKAEEEAIAEVPSPPPEPTREEVLLTEIRDLLMNK